MKKLTRCFECKKLIRFYGSYQVRVMETKPAIVTEDYVVPAKEETKTVRVCANCLNDAGYKIKRTL